MDFSPAEKLSSGDECVCCLIRAIAATVLATPPPPIAWVHAALTNHHRPGSPVAFVCLFRNIVVLISACLLLALCIFWEESKKKRASFIMRVNEFYLATICVRVCMYVCVLVHMGANGFDVNCNFMRIFISFALLVFRLFPTFLFFVAVSAPVCPAAVSCCACN